jgi:hypothetical protein
MSRASTAANTWQMRHRVALQSPKGPEIPIVEMMRAVNGYISHAESDGIGYGKWRDYILGPALGKILAAFRDLLNGDLGRLDGASLDAWATAAANRIGYDLDAGRLSPS